MGCIMSSSQNLKGSSFPLPHIGMLLVYQPIYYTVLPFKQSDFSSRLRTDRSQINRTHALASQLTVSEDNL